MRVGLLQACDDGDLFGVHLFPRQRAILREVEEERLHVWALGRRSGKTLSMALVGLWACLLRPELRERLRSGERGYAVAVAPSLRQSRKVIADAMSIVEASPVLLDTLEDASLDELRFSSGMTFAAFPCTSRGGRGWPIHTLLLDEAAWFVSDENESHQTAEQVWRALAPATAQFGGVARIVVSSTPSGPDGFFASMFRRATSGELDGAVAQHYSAAEMNPTLDRAFLDQEQLRDPLGFELEYLARFVGGGRLFLDDADIVAAVCDRGELEPDAGRGWVAGLDPAFSSDPFGLCVVGRDRLTPSRLVVGYARAWRPARRKPRSFEEQRAVEDSVLVEVAEVCRRFNATAIVDQYRAAGVIDRLRRLGVSARAEPMTESSKTAVYQELRARLVARELELYSQAELLSELRRIRTKFAAGRPRIEIPRIGGSHGDIAQALALACWHLKGWPSGRKPDASAKRGRSPLAAEYERASEGLDRGMSL